MNAAESSIEDLVENFSFLDDWEDRYRYVIELGKTLPALTEAEHSETNKVRGCASQVWLVSKVMRNGDVRLAFRGDSDALIVRGLIAILLTIYSGRSAREILKLDPEAIFAEIGLRDHLTSQRSNGLSSMVQRVKADATAALSGV